MKLLVLDGNSILNRAFYGIKLLTTKNGEFTNAIYGFLTMFRRLLDDTEPDAVAIAFDLPAPTFRHDKYGAYKAGRKGMPAELASQLPILQELLSDMGYTIVTCEGYEADDILGTLSKACSDGGHSCVLATGDRDSLQLVSDSTIVRFAGTKFGQPQITVYDKDVIKSEYGVDPCQLIDIKAIQGDTSDNIPGVAGIGAKGAAMLIQRFGTLDQVYSNIDSPDIKPAMRNKLISSRDNAFLSYELGTICTSAPINTDIPSYVKKTGDCEKAGLTMVRLELFSIIDKYGLSDKPVAEGEAADITVSSSNDSFALLTRLQDSANAYFTIEYEGGDIILMVFNIDNVIYSIVPDDVFLRMLLEDDKILKYSYDIKQLYKSVMPKGIRPRAMRMDVMLAAYLLNPSSPDYSISRLASEYGISTSAQEGFADCAVLPRLCEKISIDLAKNGQEQLLYEIEIPLAYVLAKMEDVGFYIDKSALEQYGHELKKEIDLLHGEIIEQVGYDFNINSPKQLGEALFVKLGLPRGKKTKSGYSTNADVLNELKNHSPVVNDILKYRTLTKLKSTYCDGLIKVIAQDGRIRSSFNQTETRTGRISSTEPNMQNIPVRTEPGRELRKFFIAENGVLIDADYSQIELRVLAHISQDAAMLDDFKQGRDIHTSTASRVFDIPEDMVTTDMRRKAKAVNFGIVYGIGAFSLSTDIGVSVKEADNYIKEYLKHYSGVAKYMEQVSDRAKETGYVETVFGRRRYLPELKSSNHNMRTFGERVARNMPIQGTAADIIKIAMIKVDSRLEKEGLHARLILQVHDELIVECPENEIEKVKEILTHEMCSAVDFSVIMEAESNVGKTWYDSKG